MKRIFTILAASALAGALFCSCGTQRAATGAQKAAAEVTEDNAFPFALYNTLALAGDPEENILVSPYSAAVALGMLQEGAAGKTAQEIQQVLGGFDWTAALPADPEVALTSANSAWVNAHYDLKTSYQTLLREHGALVAHLDFQSAEAPSIVNNWCADKTAGKISKIVDKFAPDDILLLVNALHFKSAWRTPFSSSADQVFHGTKGDEKTAYMYRSKHSRYAENKEAQMVELEFGEGAYAMYVILPKEEMVLSEENFKKLYAGLEGQSVRLQMPEFKLDFDASLKETLRQMGIRDAFSRNADLSGIGAGPLAVTDVNQKTFIDVNKDGCEAAAVTSISVGLTSVRPVQPVVMTVDRPFYYVIADKSAEQILFMGKLNHIK